MKDYRKYWYVRPSLWWDTVCAVSWHCIHCWIEEPLCRNERSGPAISPWYFPPSSSSFPRSDLSNNNPSSIRRKNVRDTLLIIQACQKDLEAQSFNNAFLSPSYIWINPSCEEKFFILDPSTAVKTISLPRTFLELSLPTNNLISKNLYYCQKR